MNINHLWFSENGFKWKDKYNIISGLIGGFSCHSYFGTDQSQVGRYLTTKTIEMKAALLMNRLVKVPAHVLILMLGANVVAFYQFKQQPVFNPAQEKNYYKAMRKSCS